MGLINSIKKAFTINSSNNIMPNTPADNATNVLSSPEIIFLKYASNHETNLNSFSQKYRYDYDLDYEKTIQKFLSLEYLSVESGEKAIRLYKTEELKSYLKMQGLSVSGKKEDLINRITTSGTDYESYFTKHIFILTSRGEKIIEQYENNRIQSLKDIIQKTISYIRNQQFYNIVPLFKSDGKPNNPLSLPYDEESILKDINSIWEYVQLGHNTDREIAICIVCAMLKPTYKNALNILSDIGYSDIQENELYTASAATHSLHDISEFRQINIKKYKILSCIDSNTCEKCRKMDQKIYPVSKAIIGKTIPPFCEKCRCMIVAEF